MGVLFLPYGFCMELSVVHIFSLPKGLEGLGGSTPGMVDRVKSRTYRLLLKMIRGLTRAT